MTRFKRWLSSLIWALCLSSLTLSCQLVFGDFKVGDKARSAGSGGQGGITGVSSSAIVIFPTSGLYTSESGAQAKFYVSLAKKPTSPVTMAVKSLNEAEGIASPASLVFTPVDWNAPQTVTVSGVYDPQNQRDGSQVYVVRLGPAQSETDEDVRGVTADVPITNIDNNSPGVFVTPTSGLVTTEAGGQAFFTVVLNSQPTADVSVKLETSDATAGQVALDHLTFTAVNWSAPQLVTLTGVDDEPQKPPGDHAYQITVGPLSSSDPSYASLPLQTQTVNVSNRDNDQAGVMVALATGIDASDTTRLRTSESGDSATFTVVLNKAPADTVTIEVSSTSSEGMVSPPSLTFTPNNWQAPQTVTVVGVNNDNVADGNQPYQVTLDPSKSADAAYRGLTSADLPYVNVVNGDDDKADYTVTLLSGVDPNDPSQLVTSEKGTSASFSIALRSKPTHPVSFKLSSSITDEGFISTEQIDFTVDNWDMAQVVTVTGKNDDNTKDGNVVYSVRISNPTSEDLNYQTLTAKVVKVVNLDDDVAGITLPKLLSGIDNGTKLSTTEGGGTATFSVSLTSKPTDTVTLLVKSSNTKEGKVLPEMLTFTLANYAMPQVVTVTGVNDEMVDGNQPYTVTVETTTGKDTNYVGLSQTVRVTNNDNDSAYIVPNVYMGTTTEKGGTVSFDIKLNSQPTDSVKVSFVSTEVKEGTVSPDSLTFTTANWGATQKVTVSGVDDAIVDGDRSYNVQVTGSSTDQNYRYSATTLTLINKDDDVVGLKVTAAANLQTTEAGGKVTFTVALTSQPTGNVNVTVSSSNTKEGLAAPASLVPFTASNWSVPQTVTVTGVNDAIADGNQTYTVTIKTASSSADPKYAQLGPSTVSLVNANDADAVGITVAPTSCATTPGTTAKFTVVLKSQPLGPVNISITSDTPMEGSVEPAMLSFTASNWDTVQEVTVTGVDDGTTDTMTPYKIVTAAAVSAMDSSYNGVNAADVACVNTTPMSPMPPTP